MTIIKHRILFFSPFCSSRCYPSPSTFSFLLSLTFLSLFFFLSLSLSNYSAAYLHLLTNNPNSPLSPLSFSTSLLSSLPPCSSIYLLIYHSWQKGERGMKERKRQNGEVASNLWRRHQEGKKQRRRMRGAVKAALCPQSRRTDSWGGKRESGEQQSAVAALNYGAGAGFIRIPSPHCSLSGGIKEEDTQSGFSLGPYRQRTQRMALTAAERDSGGSGGGGGREGLWGRGEREQETKAGWEGGEKQKDEGKEWTREMEADRRGKWRCGWRRGHRAILV